MIELRKSTDRGHANHGWLDSYFSFSFSEYYDPQHMGFGPLRVINEDRINPGSGFGKHAHKDMEIITYVLEGQLAHQDSMGTGSVIQPGDVQRMSAGTGIQHSEYNHSSSPTHLLQVWILPNVTGLAPSYEEKKFSRAEKEGQLRLVASADGRQGSVMMHQDASLYAGLFDGEQSATVSLLPQRLAYVHVARGKLAVNGQLLNTGDALKISGESALKIDGGEQAEVLVFDLPR